MSEERMITSEWRMPTNCRVSDNTPLLSSKEIMKRDAAYRKLPDDSSFTLEQIIKNWRELGYYNFKGQPFGYGRLPGEGLPVIPIRVRHSHDDFYVKETRSQSEIDREEITPEHTLREAKNRLNALDPVQAFPRSTITPIKTSSNERSIANIPPTIRRLPLAKTSPVVQREVSSLIDAVNLTPTHITYFRKCILEQATEYRNLVDRMEENENELVSLRKEIDELKNSVKPEPMNSIDLLCYDLERIQTRLRQIK